MSSAGFISPGVYPSEQDNSLYAENVIRTVVAGAGVFNKGPIETPTLVSNEDQLKKLFGTPIDSDTNAQAWLGFREYLRRGNQLWVCRADSTTTPATSATMSLPGASDDSLTTADDGVTSIPAVRTLTSGGAAFAVAGVVIGDVLEVADAGTPADNGFYVITLVAPTVLTVDRNWPTGSLNSLTYTVWSAKKEAGADGVTSVSTARTLTSAGSTFTTNGVVAGDILYVRDSGTTDDNGFYRITNVAMNVLTIDRDWPDGGNATLDFTVYGPISKSPTVADGQTAVAGTFGSAAAQFVLHGVVAGDILVICDPVDTGNNGCYVIATVAAASLTVTSATWPGGALAGLTFYVLAGSVKHTATSKGTWCEGYVLYPQVNASDKDNYDLELYNGTTRLDRTYNLDRSVAVARMAADSEYLTATLISGRSEPCPGFGIVDATLGIYLALVGGTDGIASIANSDYIDALNKFKNPEEYEIDLIICPSIYAESVQNALATIAETRQDCMFIPDPPDWTTLDTVQEILDYHNGVGATVIGATAMGSSYGALYWTWQKVYDEYNDAERWIAPSGHMAGVYANNDKVKAPWFAPAGTKRAKLLGSMDVRYSPTKDDRDVLYGPSNAVNSIVKFTGEGIYCYGQKTLQRATTALNRVNVRRMLNYCKRAIMKVNRTLVFDPNDEVMWREFKMKSEPVLRYVLSERGIQEYRVVADSSTTTATEIENYRMVGKIYIKPQLTAEIIVLEFTLTSQGTSFSELLAAA